MKIFGKKKNGTLESIENGVPLIAVAKPNSENGEQFNTIKTNIQFSNIDTVVKSIMITSSVASEGKTTISANIAVSFAKQGLKTLIVEADLRRPAIKATFYDENAVNGGLSTFLSSNKNDVSQLVSKTNLENLFVITSGPVPPNPTNLLESQKMEKLISIIREKFDVVIYDTPPLLPVADSQVLVKKMDGVVLVVRKNYTEQKDVKKSVDVIKRVQGKLLGTVFNDEKGANHTYYNYYGKE